MASTHAHCTWCGAQLSEAQVRAGVFVCGPDCARALEQRRADSRADAPQPVPFGNRLLDRYPKFREWVEREMARVGEPIPTLEDFVIGVERGEILAKTPRTGTALRKVTAGLRELLNSSEPGKASLDTIMGLRSRGQRPALQAEVEHYRDHVLFMDMILLRSLDEMSAEKAAEIVCAARERDDPDAWQRWGIGVSALVKRFKKAGLAHPDFVAVARRETGLSDNDVRLFLEHFPNDRLTENLKALKKKFQRQRRPN